MGGICSTYGGGEGTYSVLVGKLGRPRRRWEVYIKKDLQEAGGGAWTGFIWLRIGTRGGRL